MFGRENAERVMQRLGFRLDELSRYPPDWQDHFNFLGQDGQARQLSFRMALPKVESIYIVLLWLNPIRAFQYPIPSPNPRKTMYSYQTGPQHSSKDERPRVDIGSLLDRAGPPNRRETTESDQPPQQLDSQPTPMSPRYAATVEVTLDASQAARGGTTTSHAKLTFGAPVADHRLLTNFDDSGYGSLATKSVAWSIPNAVEELEEPVVQSGFDVSAEAEAQETRTVFSDAASLLQHSIMDECISAFAEELAHSVPHVFDACNPDEVWRCWSPTATIDVSSLPI